MTTIWMYIMLASTFYDFSATSIGGQNISMNDYAGKVVVVVNTASKCGFTPQYAGLEELYKKYKERGLVIIGFPCDQFGHQEPAENNDIQSFCKLNYGVSFPMFGKISVNGSETHPLYAYLKKEAPGSYAIHVTDRLAQTIPMALPSGPWLHSMLTRILVLEPDQRPSMEALKSDPLLSQFTVDVPTLRGFIAASI